MRYTEIAKATPFDGAPRITTPRLFGASPKKPILIRIGVVGKRPIRYKAENLVSGLTLRDNVISGSVADEGEYKIKLVCENELGRDDFLLGKRLPFIGL